MERQGEQNKEGVHFSEGGADTEREKERCSVLLSRLSVTAEEEQRKLVGCGVSHVRLTLTDSLLCYSLTHSVHSLGEMCYSSASVLSSSPPPFFLPLTRLLSLFPRTPFWKAGGVWTGGRQAHRWVLEENNDNSKGKEVTGRPAHPTAVPWRQRRVNRVEGGEWHTCPLRKLQVQKNAENWKSGESSINISPGVYFHFSPATGHPPASSVSRMPTNLLPSR